MSSIAIVGCTGLVGSQFLRLSLDAPAFAKITAVSRVPVAGPSGGKTASGTEFVNAVAGNDTAATFPAALPGKFDVLFSALATTRAAAGSFDKQYTLEHDLNLELARKAAEECGCKTYVLVSAQGADAGSRFAYPRMKGELEENVATLPFEKIIILQPGLLLGERDENRTLERWSQNIANGMVRVGLRSLADKFSVRAADVAKAGLQALKAPGPDRIVRLQNTDLIRLAAEYDAGK
ncbi:protein fmp52-1, mitochondrial [Dipodascopsis tothii]|uniref:protein fmp52-1, mitochondrial n=1 Tax=Dipodascopsis tothii TaxID=44089 RepID=UPI0034CF4BAF